MNQKLILTIISLIIILIAGCAQNIPKEKPEPNWVQELIKNETNNPVANPPASISKCIYKNNTVYYLPARCCDIPSILYDKDGNIICHPDGGFIGSGDNKCSDFFDESIECKFIWQDTRSYP